jgi:hypothetical protein
MSKSIPAGGPFKAAVGLHEPLTGANLREAKKALLNYCLAGPDFCRKYLEVINNVSDLIAKVRLDDLLFEEKYEGVDAELFKALRAIVNTYAKILAGEVAGYGDRILVITTRETLYNGKHLKEGEILLLPISEALILTALSVVTPVESNLLKLASLGRGAGDS